MKECFDFVTSPLFPIPIRFANNVTKKKKNVKNIKGRNLNIYDLNEILISNERESQSTFLLFILYFVIAIVKFFRAQIAPHDNLH